VSSPSLLAEIYDYDSNSSDNDTQFHTARQRGGDVNECSSDNLSSLLTASINDESAIVPYHDSNNLQVQQQRSPRSELLHRQQEVLAIREHLEHMHESESLLSNTVSTSNDNGWNRANTQSTLISVDESFNNPSLQQQYIPPRSDKGVPPPPPLSKTQPSSSTSSSSSSSSPTSWSVEHHPLSLSRYQREFIQISLLATGSFGSVYHAIHKLEYPQPYAIKCVTFTTCGYYATTLSLVMREVRILAKLDHPNCVRYYTSWLEPSWMTGGTIDNNNNNNIMIKEEDDDDEEEEGCFNDINPIYPLLPNRQHATSSGSNSSSNPKLLTDIDRVLDGLHKSKEIDESVSQLEAILYGDKCDDNNDDGFDWTMDSPRNERSVLSLLPLSHRYSRGTSGDDDSEVCSEWTQDDYDGECSNNSFHNSKVYARQRSSLENRYLASPTATSSSYRYQISMYIQMQLCNPRTLAEWISDRNINSNNCINKYDEEWARSAIEIFKQIVSGLTHVHSKGIIHRDLKPANIFSSDDGTFMIGDFGLSKMISDANTNEHLHTTTNGIVHQQHNSNGHHTVGVGTASYASTEQITSKTYGPASDIYSLGLILLELIGNFTSEHERAKAFHDCRYKREVMPWLCQEYPEISLLILSCTETDPTRRPLASDILTAELLTNEGTRVDYMVQNLKTELSLLKMDVLRKDNIIESQAKALKEKDNIIENLTLRLANLESRIVVNENKDVPPYPQDPANYQP
jgi:serine/threonine protein kinase